MFRSRRLFSSVAVLCALSLSAPAFADSFGLCTKIIGSPVFDWAFGTVTAGAAVGGFALTSQKISSRASLKRKSRDLDCQDYIASNETAVEDERSCADFKADTKSMLGDSLADMYLVMLQLLPAIPTAVYQFGAHANFDSNEKLLKAYRLFGGITALTTFGNTIWNFAINEAANQVTVPESVSNSSAATKFNDYKRNTEISAIFQWSFFSVFTAGFIATNIANYIKQSKKGVIWNPTLESTQV